VKITIFVRSLFDSDYFLCFMMTRLKNETKERIGNFEDLVLGSWPQTTLQKNSLSVKEIFDLKKIKINFTRPVRPKQQAQSLENFPLLASEFLGLDSESKEALSRNLSGEAHCSCYPTKID